MKPVIDNHREYLSCQIRILYKIKKNFLNFSVIADNTLNFKIIFAII